MAILQGCHIKIESVKDVTEFFMMLTPEEREAIQKVARRSKEVAVHTGMPVLSIEKCEHFDDSLIGAVR